MAKVDIEYHKLLEEILNKGYTYNDPNRKNVKRLEIPSYTFRHEFKDGFPAITTKKLHYKNVVTELLWFLTGNTNIKYLIDNGCNIWNKDAYNYYLKSRTEEKYNNCYCGHTTDCECGVASIDNFIDGIKNGSGLGDLGPVYGHQWRNFNGVDQISNLIKSLKKKPLGTEHIVNSWNASDKPYMALPPCHYGFQVVVRPLTQIEIQKDYFIKFPEKIDDSKFLSNDVFKEILKEPQYGFELHWSQRSVDTFLGLPYNIASYATLALIIEKLTGYKALAIQGDLKKVHLYNNSIDAVKEQLSRDIDKYSKCELKIDNNYNWNNFDGVLDVLSPNPENGDFILENYESYPHIKVEMLERDE